MIFRIASFGQFALVPLLFLSIFFAASVAVDDEHDIASDPQLIHKTANQHVLHDLPRVPSTSEYLPIEHLVPASSHDALHELRGALATMQDEYFSLWLGKWTTAIDWTAAVTNTYISATLSSMSRFASHITPGTSSSTGINAHDLENDINKYFAQTTAFYYGEEAFAIRMQAFDDMLWVVLEWLESIQLIAQHTTTHHSPWHAQQFLPVFAHRARIFYSLASQGWDTRLCGGGMTWNPRLLPYKNAITNQLWIAASVSMYLHFPGDENCSPFFGTRAEMGINEASCNPAPYDATFLHNAVKGYDWLQGSNMTNEQGLYTDGFHIHNYRTNKSATTCDERNEMVYTYNQGVILSGLRGLWEGTGNTTYLVDGYKLIANVVEATGWKADDENWHGLGRRGVLEELCDQSGRCNQDAQTFKGIFWHHLSAFCMPLPRRVVREGKTYAANRELADLHSGKCVELVGWVMHNAHAALGTRDKKGRFGGWWGAPMKDEFVEEEARVPEGAVDYRNLPALIGELDIDDEAQEMVVQDRRYSEGDPVTSGDLNDRGRGRTVETQGSGLAVVRAMYECLKLSEERENTG